DPAGGFDLLRIAVRAVQLDRPDDLVGVGGDEGEEQVHIIVVGYDDHMMLWVLTQLVGPSWSAVIDGVSYFARLKVDDLYTARLRCRTCSSTRAGTQNAIRCPDFAVV